MLLDKEKSICSERKKVIVSEENHRKHVANNVDGDTVLQFRIDGGIIPRSSAVCATIL